MRPTRDETLLSVAKIYAQRSTCLRRKVGAVIGDGGRVLSTGYVGSPSNAPHCTPDNCTPAAPCLRTIHAEANSIAWAARKGISIEGATLYTTVSPCISCAQAIAAAGIGRVIYIEEYRDLSPIEWLVDFAGIPCLQCFLK
jgi:dCMP deaminase